MSCSSQTPMPREISAGGIDWFEIDWAGELPGPFLAAGDAIQGSPTVTVEGAGYGKADQQVSGAKVLVRASAPTVKGAAGRIICTVDTQLGRRATHVMDLVTV